MKTLGVELQIMGGPKEPLSSNLRRLLRRLRITQGSWTISLVGDAEMAGLHGRTMGLRTTTDVLTFDLRDADPDSNRKSKNKERNFLDLDTIICLDEAKRRAGELGHSPHNEILLYALHSLLHVQGYDDVAPAQAARMHAREDELLEAIGIGRVYAKRQTPSAKRQAAPPIKTRNSKLETRNSRRLP